MTTWEIECVEPGTNHTYCTLIQASTLQNAKIRAVNEGNRVVGMDLPDFFDEPKDTANPADGGLIAVAFLFPIIGIFIGCVRAGTQRKGAGGFIAASIGGMLVWMVLFAAIASH